MNGVLGHYYKNDDEVCQDSELQKWIQDIFEHGFLSQECTGVPKDTLMFCLSESPYCIPYIPLFCFICLLDRRLTHLCRFDEFTGIPQEFRTVAEMVKFVTMVIFTCSGQHSAVNTGQVDNF